MITEFHPLLRAFTLRVSLSGLLVGRRDAVSSFGIYMIGFIILVAGLAYGASVAGLQDTWIIVGVIVLIGLGIIMGVSNTKRRDPPGGPQV